MRSKLWTILYAVLLAAVFAFNAQHVNQQGIFESVYREIAQNLLSGEGYTFPLFGGAPATYPLWGYSALVAADEALGGSNIFLIIVQIAMASGGAAIFYRMFQINPKLWHIPLLTPFFALMSVKWADAPAGFLLLLFAYFAVESFRRKSGKYAIFCGIALGFLFNFRGEYLAAPLLMIVALAAAQFDERKAASAIKIIIFGIVAAIFIFPWGVWNLVATGNFRPTATNGGAVAYISLGQLPDNPWNIEPRDSAFYEAARNAGYENPYSPDADNFLKEQTYSAIKSRPLAYAKKCALNFVRALAGGVYTGEYANVFISRERRAEIDAEIESKPGATAKFFSLFDYKFDESAPLVVEKSLQILSRAFVFGLFAIFIATFFIKLNHREKTLFFVVATIVLYKLAVVSLLQYEYRHINPIYLLLLGNAFVAAPKIREKLLFKRKKG